MDFIQYKVKECGYIYGIRDRKKYDGILEVFGIGKYRCVPANSFRLRACLC